MKLKVLIAVTILWFLCAVGSVFLGVKQHNMEVAAFAIPFALLVVFTLTFVGQELYERGYRRT